MSLDPGHKLAHYEILEPIGKGGMGEVYRAKDGKLGRDVAIKVLPDEFAQDDERLRRFQREAKVLASLNHPNIASIYGLERSGDTHYLVLELVPGETLAERIARGPLRVDEVLEIATKIAEALEEAHEQGIVHRDLKPANVKLTPDDKVKVLDFGLAKAFVDHDPVADDSLSPTITRDATSVGVILGTAAYMSPEQAKGKPVDRRTDIFAYGAVIYEMLTGRKAFPGENVSDTLATVIKDEPDWNRLPAGTPETMRRVMRRCLTKPVASRLQHIGDARIELHEPMSPSAPNPAPTTRGSLVPAMAFAAGIAVGAAWWLLSPDEAVQPEPVSRWTLQLGAGASVARFTSTPVAPQVAVSPDGRYLAYVATDGGPEHLYLRAADSLHAVAVDEGERALMPFFSPDSSSLGFATAEGPLMKVSVQGGAPVFLADIGRNPRGASWSIDGTIFFTPQSGGVYRLEASGGEPLLVASPRRALNEKAYRLPDTLPGGRHVLLTIMTNEIESFDEASLAVLDVASGDVRTVLDGGSNARYSPSGHLIYTRGGSLFAVPFDDKSLEVIGPPIRVVEDVAAWTSQGTADYDLSDNGLLFYAPGGPMGNDYRVVSVDRTGRASPLVPDVRAFYNLRLSPDGRSLAVSTNEANMVLWSYDIERRVMSRLVSGFNNWKPTWSPKSDTVAFSSDREGIFNIFTVPAGGGDSPRLLIGAVEQNPTSWSLDGASIVFEQFTESETGWDIWLVSFDGSGARPLLNTAALERRGAVSPNGRWLAYDSDASGRYEVYVTSFPAPGEHRRVSVDGGRDARWSPSGGELFFRNGATRLMAIDVATGGELELGTPRLLFESDHYVTNSSAYDVAADGEHLIMIDRSESRSPPTELVVVQNWAEELKRLVLTEN